MAAICDRCGGTGWIAVDDMTLRKCICAYAKELRVHLGDIALAKILKESPLYVPGGDDLTGTNLFIKGNWDDLTPHLKWVLTFKTPSFKYNIVTDEKLKTVYVGAESYAARAKGSRDDMVTYNCLADLIGQQYSLVIIKIGKLGYPNKAMPGILKESLMLREALGLATWIVEEPHEIFGPGHKAYSDDVAKYIRDGYEIVDISKAPQPQNKPVEPPKKKAAPKPVEDVSLEDVLEEDSPQPEPAFKETDWSIAGSADSRPKNRSGWRPRKRQGGGGPV
jgi:hypothetical protein